MDTYWIDNLGETNKNGRPETRQERKVSSAWARLSRVTNNLFRIQGRIRKDAQGTKHSEITLTTEVVERCARPKFWNKVYAFALATDARIEWEYTCKANEHEWREDAKGRKIKGSDKYGPDHGKLV